MTFNLSLFISSFKNNKWYINHIAGDKCLSNAYIIENNISLMSRIYSAIVQNVALKLHCLANEENTYQRSRTLENRGERVNFLFPNQTSV